MIHISQNYLQKLRIYDPGSIITLKQSNNGGVTKHPAKSNISNVMNKNRGRKSEGCRAFIEWAKEEGSAKEKMKMDHAVVYRYRSE